MDGIVKEKSSSSVTRKPDWLKVRLPGGERFIDVKELVRKQALHTVCESAHCPNIGECWNRRTATFMIMGNQCTRNCRFCAVQNGIIEPLDVQEPARVADAVAALNLMYVVITSVTRDDLEDGGAFHFAQTIHAVRKAAPECKIEVLIPDLKGSADALQTIIHAAPDVLNHNVETVPRLYPSVRPQAVYSRSLMLLKRAAEQGMVTKSGLMVGLGETMKEVHEVMNDLLQVNCRMLTIGQYLQPTIHHLPVVRYVDPEEFTQFRKHGLASGFRHIEAGPLVRSSYHADHQYGSL